MTNRKRLGEREREREREITGKIERICENKQSDLLLGQGGHASIIKSTTSLHVCHQGHLQNKCTYTHWPL